MRWRGTAVAVAVALVVAGCSHKHKVVAAPPPPPPPPKPTVWTNPLTGLRGGPHGPVAAIKVDNVEGARPLHTGLGAADLVYVEVVEGGDTRLMAMFVGRSPVAIGPIRSARDTDLEILQQYGRVLFGFSGANSGVLAHIHAANVVDVSQEEHPDAYTQNGRRPEAYNFYTSALRLATTGAAGHPVDIRDVGFRFGATPGGGRPVRGHVVDAMTPYSNVGFVWDPRRHAWLVDLTGHGEAVSPANILVQFVPLAAGHYVDVLGNNSPDSRTVGAGTVVLFRDGQRFNGRWSRPRPNAVTRFTGADGKDLPLHTGTTWLLVTPIGAALQGG